MGTSGKPAGNMTTSVDTERDRAEVERKPGGGQTKCINILER